MARSAKFCLLCGSALQTKHDGERDRLTCPDPNCGYIHYANPAPVVAALVEHEGDVILIQNKGWPATWFGLVSGFLERGESPEDGVLRELEEELGLQGRIVELIGVYAFEMRNELIVAYHVEASGEIAIGHELEAYKRVPPDKLRPWPMGTGHAVKHWLEKHHPKPTP